MSKLHESSLTHSHHYYVVFMDLPSVQKTEKLISILFPDSIRRKVTVGETGFNHIQIKIARRFGSLSVLQNNESKVEDETLYIYDFFVGTIVNNGQNLYFVCYPYLKLGRYIENILKTKSFQISLQKPVLKKLLVYMKHHKGSVVYDGGLKADIVQYGAEIVSDNTVISISGSNPLQSKVYRQLEEVKELNIEPVKLKLQCKSKIGGIQISFDRLGNYRFWIGNDEDNLSAVAMLPEAFRVFQSADALVTESFINNYSILEDGK